MKIEFERTRERDDVHVRDAGVEIRAELARRDEARARENSRRSLGSSRAHRAAPRAWARLPRLEHLEDHFLDVGALFFGLPLERLDRLIAQEMPSWITKTRSEMLRTSLRMWLLKRIAPILAKPKNEVAERHDLERIEAVGGLVEDDHLRIVDQRRGDSDALAESFEHCWIRF